MRTTIDIPDGIYQALKSQAAAEGSSVKALILDATRERLLRKAAPRGPRKFVPPLKSKAPGSLVATNAELYDLIDFP